MQQESQKYKLVGIIGNGAEGVVLRLKRVECTEDCFLALKLMSEDALESFEREKVAIEHINSIDAIREMTPCIDQKDFSSVVVDCGAYTPPDDTSPECRAALQSLTEIDNPQRAIYMATRAGASDLSHVKNVCTSLYDTDTSSMCERAIRRLRAFIQNLVTVNMELLRTDTFHNDIKPANVLYLGEGDGFWLIDFGGMTIEGCSGAACNPTITPLFSCYYSKDKDGEFGAEIGAQARFLTDTVAGRFAENNSAYFPTNETEETVAWAMYLTMKQTQVCTMLFSAGLTVCMVGKQMVDTLSTRHADQLRSDPAAENKLQEVRSTYLDAANMLFNFDSSEMPDDGETGSYAAMKAKCMEIMGNVLSDVLSATSFSVEAFGGDALHDALHDVLPSTRFNALTDLVEGRKVGYTESEAPEEQYTIARAGEERLFKSVKLVLVERDGDTGFAVVPRSKPKTSPVEHLLAILGKVYGGSKQVSRRGNLLTAFVLACAGTVLALL